MHKVLGRFDEQELGIDVLFAQSKDDVVVKQTELPPILADLHDVVKGVDVADCLRVDNEVFRQSPAMRVLPKKEVYWLSVNLTFLAGVSVNRMLA